jgi:alpha-tubulin suppressor-like RCC1 family protein
LGCNDLTLPSQALPLFIMIATGDGQAGEVGTPLPDSLVVRVTDGTGRPVQHVVVRFVPLGLAADGELIPDTVSTNADGRASTRWVLGTRAGPAQLEAKVSNGQGEQIAIRFSATALPGPVAYVRLVRGDGQSATVGEPLADSLVVRVIDRFGNPLTGESVAWQTDDGGVLSSGTALTDTSGRTAVAWRLGEQAGPQSTLATVTALADSPVTFGATALPGAAIALLRIHGDSQTAPVGTTLTDSIVARLVDEFGNGVPGRSINWVAGSGGGNAVPATGTTDENGYAFSQWTLGPASGIQLMNGVVSGYAPATFTAMAVSQSAASITAASSTALVGQAGTPVTPLPAVRVTDANGNPVQGVTVTFTAGVGSGQVSNQTGQGRVVTIATDDAGIAAVTAWTLGPIADPDTLEASAVGLTGPLAGSPVRFIAFVLPGPPARLDFLQQPTQTAAGDAMSPPVTVAVHDSHGNLTPGYSGTVTLALGSAPPGGTLRGTTTAGVVGGIASFGGLTFDLAGAGYALVAASQPLLSPATSNAFEITAGAGARLVVVTQPSDTAASGVPFLRQPAIRLMDALGNPLGQVDVPITASIAAGGGTLGGSVTVATDAAGLATFTNLSLSGLAGPRTLLFTSPGLQSITSTPVELLSGTSAALTLAAGAGQSADVGMPVAVPPAVKVADASGNPVAGVAVTFAVTGGGGSITGPNAVTDAQGLAAVGSWRLGPTAGTNTLTATVPGLAGSPLAITAIGRFAYAAVRAGGEFSCGISTAGLTYCWGRNNRGQLGNGGTTDQLTPVAVAGGYVFRTIGLGNEHGCGLTDLGEAFCWGLNADGQLGDGTTSNRLTPVPVAAEVAFASIEGGGTHTCAVAGTGAAYCWGANNSGQLGDGTTTARSTPVPVTGNTLFSSIAPGSQFTCGLAADATIYCWGANNDGELGDASKKARPTPAPISGSGWTTVAAGDEHACALGDGGLASCWGRNDKGQLGRVTKGSSNTQPGPVDGGLAFSRLEAGGKHSCALTGAGAAFCWGQNASGQLGDGTTTDHPVPTAVQGGLLFVNLSAGATHTVAVTSAGAGYGWGRDANGQLGTGTTTNKLAPVRVGEP